MTARYQRDVYQKKYPGVLKYYRGTSTRVGAQVLTVEEYNDQAAKLEEAINRTITPEEPQEQAEQRGKVFHIGGLTAATRTRTPGELRRTDKAGNYRLRIGVGSKKTLELLLGASTWDVQASIQEGQDGATFYTPVNSATESSRIQIPVKGLCIDMGGDWEQIQIFNRTNNAQIYDISAALIEGRAQEGTLPRMTNSGVNAEIYDYSHHVSFTVPGGVQAGDTIQQLSYENALLQTYPAREGGVYGFHLRAAFVKYVPAGAAVNDISWTFYRRV